MYFGNACQNAILPTLVRPSLPTVQPSLDMKQFLPFPLDTTTVNLFPNFSANMVGISRTEQGSPICSWKTGLPGRRLCVSMDPVQKAVINHTFGVPPPPKRKHVVSCSVCQLRFNSQSQASAHYKGTKHAKKLKALEAPKCKHKTAAVTKETTNKDTPKSTYPPRIPTSTDRTDNAAGAGTLPLSPPVTGPSMSTGGDSDDTSTKEIKEVPPCTPAVQPTPSSSPSPPPLLRDRGRDRDGGGEGQAPALLLSLQSGRQLSFPAGGPQQRHKAQDNAGGPKWKWNNQVLPQTWGQGEAGSAQQVSHGSAEQNVSL
ncbi:zinc finger protein 385D [Anguilla anguilla]|uniref:zinc finger protein 385D n=1 Tax=Anguilla anguilla TaxID=7936 RepID=UPI0015AA92D4|nr:zinc finger protein 385D [Anguilla anguilla]